jgi:hypothetical protein
VITRREHRRRRAHGGGRGDQDQQHLVVRVAVDDAGQLQRDRDRDRREEDVVEWKPLASGDVQELGRGKRRSIGVPTREQNRESHELSYSCF